MLKKLSLTIGEQRIVDSLTYLQEGQKADVDVSRMIREVRRRLDLRTVGHIIDRITNWLIEYNYPGLGWEILAEPTEIIEELEEKRKAGGEEDKDEVNRIERLIADLKALMKRREFTLDEAYISWLRDRLRERDWGIRYIASSDGRVSKQFMTPSPDQLSLVADLADALDAAKAMEGEK